jgi:predicted DCC family thiol-disulfide oxidoreductase YuxK
MARWVRRRVPPGRVLAVPNQAPGALERHGLTRAEADRAAWLIAPDGRRFEGAAAVSRVLEEVPGWRGLARLYRFRPMGAIEEAFYRAFARNRSRFARFGVTPECDEPGAPCA